MAKLKNPLLSLRASGSLARVITFLHRGRVDLVEKKPEIKDVGTDPQLGWRTMFNLCVDLWHELSAAEKAVWESAGTARHMTGYAWYMSQCLRPNPGIYLPLAGGTMSGDIEMASHKITDLPDPIALQEPVTAAFLQAIMTTHIALPSVHHPIVEVAVGNYVGNGAGPRQITTGFLCGAVIIMYTPNQTAVVIPSKAIWHKTDAPYHLDCETNIAIHGSDGFSVGITAGGFFNAGDVPYYWWAVSR